MTPEPERPIPIEVLRAAACDRRAAPFDLTSLWPALRERSCRIVWDYCDETTASLAIERGARPLEPHLRSVCNAQLDALERVLGGVPQKVIAYEQRLAPSSTAIHLNRALGAIGARGPVSRAPLLLLLAVHAAARGEPLPASSRVIASGGRILELIDARRPESCLSTVLTESELAVAKLLVEGRTYCDIASLRGTSLRTIANQLVSVFRKVGASGRAELVSRTVELAGNGRRLEWSARSRHHAAPN